MRRADNLAFEMLPCATERAPGLEAVAAAAFDAPEFISGIVKLPPGSVKDEESTHNCTQVFVVRLGQERALQVSAACAAVGGGGVGPDPPPPSLPPPCSCTAPIPTLAPSSRPRLTRRDVSRPRVCRRARACR